MKKDKITPTHVEIDYPRKSNEAEVEATLWWVLKRNNIDARLQVLAPQSKLDIVVFVNGWAVCIVECKSWGEAYARMTHDKLMATAQIKRYKSIFSIPVLLCSSLNDVTTTYRKIREIIDATPKREQRITEYLEPF